MVEVRFNAANVSAESAQELRQLAAERLPATDVRVGTFAQAFKLAPGGVPWFDIYVLIKPAAFGAGAYLFKKVIDVVADLVKDWAKSKLSKQNRRVTILGPDGRAVRVISLPSDGKPEVVRTKRKMSAEELSFHFPP